MLLRCFRISMALLLVGIAAERAAAESLFSAWDAQFLYGASYKEPDVQPDIPKVLITIENAAAWNWGSSYFFVDCLRSFSEADSDATEVYAEWYPSFSLRHLAGKEPGTGAVRDISMTPAINAGVRSTGSQTLVLLPGITVDFNVPHFKYLSLQVLAYIDRSNFQGEDYGVHATSFQITPSWSVPFRIGKANLSFDGFFDYIGEHGVADHQFLAQPQLKLDVSTLWGAPGKLLAGVEWQVWRNKYGVPGVNESVPQVLLFWNL